MRLKYYKLTLRQMRLKKPFVFLLVTTVTVAICVQIFNHSIEPTMKSLCESNAKSIALRCSNQAVEHNIQDVKYESLVSLDKAENGKVNAITANVMEMNKISNKVSIEVQQLLEQSKESKITFPIGVLFGKGLYAGYGPRININTVPSGTATTQFYSEFEEAGINQTKHRIFLRITLSVKIIAPFYVDTQQYSNDILVAETIIVGDTPSTYYNVNGVQGLEQKDMLNMLDNANPK